MRQRHDNHRHGSVFVQTLLVARSGGWEVGWGGAVRGRERFECINYHLVGCCRERIGVGAGGVGGGGEGAEKKKKNQKNQAVFESAVCRTRE